MNFWRHCARRWCVRKDLVRLQQQKRAQRTLNCSCSTFAQKWRPVFFLKGLQLEIVGHHNLERSIESKKDVQDNRQSWKWYYVPILSCEAVAWPMLNVWTEFHVGWGSSSLFFNPKSHILYCYGCSNGLESGKSIEIERHFFKMSYIFQPKICLRFGYDKDYIGYIFVTLVHVNTFPEFEMSEFCSKMVRTEDGQFHPVFDPKCPKWHGCTCSMEKTIGLAVFYPHARVFVGLGWKDASTMYLIKEL